jgi:K+-sensing histidine kinase KdpD
MAEKDLSDIIKSRVLKSFSHELKSPLNGVICTVDVLFSIIKNLHKKN